MTDEDPGPTTPAPEDAQRPVGDERPAGLPADLPRSPTGRIPAWVLDEAVGRPVGSPMHTAPFRSWPDPPPPAADARRGRRRWAAVAALTAVAVTLGAGLWGARGPAEPQAAPRAAPTPSTPRDTPVPSPTPEESRPDSAGPVPGYEESPRPSSLPEADLRQRSGTGYVFTSFQRDKRTGVTWSPCRPVHWVLRGSSNAPEDGRQMLREAFARVSELTGLEIVFDGTTGEKYSDRRQSYQPKRYGQRWAPVLVSWSSTSQDPGLRGDVLGRAGAQWSVSESGDRAYISGTVSLDYAQIERTRRSFGYDVARAVVMHELGHLMGLGHAQSRRSLMNARINPSVTDFAAADRAGLEVLGDGPCQPDI